MYYLTVFIRNQEFNSKNQYDVLSEQWKKAKTKCDEIYTLDEVNKLKTSLEREYPHLEFERKPMGD